MYIFKTTKLRANQYARYVDEQGTQYHQVPMELLEEIPDPARGNDEIEYTQELSAPPYIQITPKSQEQLDMQHNTKVKQQIAAIEAGQARAVREAALGDTTHIAAINASIEVLRATLLPEPPREG
jgi:hypothetical protein